MKQGTKIIWTSPMVEKLVNEFAIRFNSDLAADLGISLRSVIRKAREIGLEKEAGFLDKNRQEISRRASQALAPNPMKGVKGWSVPGGEAHRFQPGQRRFDNNYEKMRISRNDLIRRERLRIKYGLPQKTKLNLKNNIY